MLRYAIIKSHFEENPELNYEVIFDSYETATEVLDNMESLHNLLLKTVPAANGDKFAITPCENMWGQLIQIEVSPKSGAMYPSDYYRVHTIRMVASEKIV